MDQSHPGSRPFRLERKNKVVAKQDKFRTVRAFPVHTLQEALAVPQKIQDERAGKPMKRLLLADALGIKPNSTNFRDILSSSHKYGLTEGTEKAEDIVLTPLGSDAVQTTDPAKRLAALRQAVLHPPVFQRFFEAYQNAKLPSPGMLQKVLVSEYGVASAHAEQCANTIMDNGRFAEIIRDVSGSPYFMFDGETSEREPEVVSARPHSC